MNGTAPCRNIGRFGGLNCRRCSTVDPGRKPLAYSETRAVVNVGAPPGAACATNTSIVWRMRGVGPFRIGASSICGPNNCDTSSRRS